MDDAPESVHHGFQAMLAAQVIGAWTAFEALLERIWIDCVNARPKTLGEPALLLRMKGGTNKVTLPVQTLEKIDWNLKAKIGTFLTDEDDGPIRFERLDKIRDIYDKTFGRVMDEPTRQRMDNLIFSWKKRLLEALRNVFAHAGGVVDGRFRFRIQGHPDERWTKLGLEDTILLNGVETTDMCADVYLSGIALLSIANEVLTAHRL